MFRAETASQVLHHTFVRVVTFVIVVLLVVLAGCGSVDLGQPSGPDTGGTLPSTVIPDDPSDADQDVVPSDLPSEREAIVRASSSFCCNPLSVDFRVHEPGGGPSPVSYVWDFGDGKTGQGPDPQHTYGAPRDYGVTVAIGWDDGATTEHELDLSFVNDADQGLVLTVAPDPAGPVQTAGGALIADAGRDQAAAPGDWVTLDGTGSALPAGEEVASEWYQIGGPSVVLSEAGSLSSNFHMPQLAEGQYLEFELVLLAGDVVSSDSVRIWLPGGTPADRGSGNTAPTVFDISSEVIMDLPAVIRLGASDQDGDDLEFSIIQAPSHGTLSKVLNAPSSFATVEYEPEEGYLGEDVFTYVATDGEAESEVGTVTLTVRAPANRAPIISDQVSVTGAGESVVLELHGSDPDGDDLTFEIVSDPSHGILSELANGPIDYAQLAYLPDAGFAGTDTFVFRATDGVLYSEPAVFSVMIEPRAVSMGGDRILITHPSHLRWWILPNMEANPENARMLTGVLCLFVEGRSAQEDGVHWLDEVRTRSEALGWDFSYGVRHSHQTIEDYGLPMTSEWQNRTVTQFVESGLSSFALDMEPYYYGELPRYHREEDYGALREACEPWQNLGDVDLYVYPAGPFYWHGRALIENAMAGGTQVYALDPSTYNPYRQEDPAAFMAERAASIESMGMQFRPGFYLTVMNDQSLLREADRYGGCWFFARGTDHVDDLPNFGTPEWDPEPLEGQP